MTDCTKWSATIITNFSKQPAASIFKEKYSILMEALNNYKTFLLIYRTTGCCNSGNQFDVHKSVHHHTVQINQPTRCNSFKSLLFDVYVWLNMFRAPLCPSSGAYNCTRSLWFYRWSVVVGALLVVVWQVILPYHDQQRSNRHSPTGKTRGS
jgi:hypothetical protein